MTKQKPPTRTEVVRMFLAGMNAAQIAWELHHRIPAPTLQQEEWIHNKIRSALNDKPKVRR